MITLDTEQLKTLTNDPSTRTILCGLYKWQDDKGYKVYTLCVGSLRRADTQFLGRVLVARDRTIKTNVDDSFMVASVWGPGKQKDARQYYLVKG